MADKKIIFRPSAKVNAVLDKIIFAGLVLYAAFAVISITLCQIGFFILAFAAWMLKIVYNRKTGFKSTPVALPLLVFINLTLFSCFTGIGLMDSIGMGGYYKTASLMVMLPLVLNNVSDKKKVKTLVLLLILSAAAQSGYVIYKAFTGNYFNTGEGVSGTVRVTLTLGAILTIVICLVVSLLFSEKNRVLKAFLWTALILCFTGLVFTMARGSWIAVLIALFVLGLIRNKKLAVAVALGALLIYGAAHVKSDNILAKKFNSIFTTERGTNLERKAMWKTGLNIIKDYPLGIGLNNVGKVYAKYKMPEARYSFQGHLHNTFIQIAVERGIPALLAFLWFIAVYLIAAYRRYREEKDGGMKAVILGVFAGFIGFLAAGLTEYSFGPSLLIQVVWFTAGLSLLQFKKRKKS